MERKIIDSSLAKAILPVRKDDGNKGSFGKLLLLVGSERYRGAAHLVTEAALRGGVGYTTLASETAVTDSVLSVFPEALFSPLPPFAALTKADIDRICDLDLKNSATVIGPGCSSSDTLRALTLALIGTDGAPLVIDADAINSLAKDKDLAIKSIVASKRRVILTPHPLEFSRISGFSPDEIATEREECAVSFARRAGCILLLKGKGTVITDGDRIAINSSGSSALAKAGSGDVLSGLLGALLATGTDAFDAAALAAYVHGAAADTLSEKLSSFGVTPSDLPRAMAQILCSLEKQK